MAEQSTTSVNPLDWARQYLSGDEYQALLESLDSPLDTSIRINTLKWDASEAEKKLSERYGWELETVPFCPSGFWVMEYELSPSAAIEHSLGYFYIQEAASMLPAELFDLNGIDSPLILDMAASPGGKTTHLASLSSGRGLIVANDGSRSRIPALQIVLRNWGAIDQCVTCLPGESFGDLFPDTFDAVLLDAPCSMQGLRAAESHASRPITLTEIDSLAARQTRLLESALRAAKPGGQVVYSTCTLSPQEDELVLAAIIEKFGDSIRVEDVSGRLPAPSPALTRIGDRRLPAQINNALRLWPHRFGTAGFFTARLTRLGELPETKEGEWRRRTSTSAYTQIPKQQSQMIAENLQEHFGFDLETLIEKGRLLISGQKNKVFLIPEKLNYQFRDLHFLSAGMELGKSVRDDFIPSHEFVSRFGDQFSKGTLILEERYLESWSRGEDIRGFKTNEFNTGEILAVRDGSGRNLGRGKLLADRLKNMLPTRLF